MDALRNILYERACMQSLPLTLQDGNSMHVQRKMYSVTSL